MAARLGVLLVSCGLTVGPTLAASDDQRPLSSIDWLSNSVALPEVTAPRVDDAPTGATTPEVDVRPLDGTPQTSLGLFEAAEIALPGGLWGAMSTAETIDALGRAPTNLPPSAREFLRDLLVVQAPLPIDAIPGDEALLLARIDKLLELGRLDDAAALIALVETETPRLFRRHFDIALLRGEEGETCQMLEETPDLLGTFSARIFCLARNGEWDVAALTLGTAEALGYLTPDEDALLLKFLDPELFEDDPVPVPKDTPSPLVFRLYDAIGERLPTETLPIAFAEADLFPTVGWRKRLRAAERLTAAGAMAPETFFEILFRRQPAASGEFWDRIAALQAAESALLSGRRIEDTLADGWRAAREDGLAAAIAPRWSGRLSGKELTGPARRAAFEIALLAGRPELAKSFVGRSDEDTALLHIASGEAITVPGTDMLSRAIRRGLSQAEPPERFLAEIEQRGPGAGLLTALRLVSEVQGGDPDAAGDALALLRKLGREDLARQIAVELLLEDRTL